MLNVKDIKTLEENREVVESHVLKMKRLIEENGFADTIKVVHKDNVYYAVEGQHRKLALISLGIEQVPCSVVDWIDELEAEDDDFSIQNYIVSLNAHNKKWSLYDFIKSNSRSNHINAKKYESLRSAMVQNQKLLSNGVVASCFDGERRYHNKLKDKSFSNWDIEFSMDLVESLSTLVARYGKRALSAQVTRAAASEIFSSKTKDRYKLMSAFESAVKRHFATNGTGEDALPIPDGDDSFSYWWKDVVLGIEMGGDIE